MDAPREGFQEVEEWLREYGNALYRHALGKVNEPEVAEELVQQTFLAALESHHRYQRDSSAKHWLMGILRHKILDYFRQLYAEKPFQEFDDKLYSEKTVDSSGKVTPRSIPNPLQMFESEELKRILKHCIEALPERMRFVYLQREMEGDSTQWICENLGISENNFHVIMHRCRRLLKDCFVKHGIEKIDDG